jgi:hypothetical protein
MVVHLGNLLEVQRVSLTSGPCLEKMSGRSPAGSPVSTTGLEGRECPCTEPARCDLTSRRSRKGLLIHSAARMRRHYRKGPSSRNALSHHCHYTFVRNESSSYTRIGPTGWSHLVAQGSIRETCSRHLARNCFLGAVKGTALSLLQPSLRHSRHRKICCWIWLLFRSLEKSMRPWATRGSRPGHCPRISFFESPWEA